jgi:hypothetical protein
MTSRCLLLAHSGHENRVGECLLWSAKQTLIMQTSMSANDPNQKSITRTRGSLPFPPCTLLAQSRHWRRDL